MNFDEAIAWIDSFHQFDIRLGLNRILKVLDTLGNPHKKIKVVHVAGTNGKGSVCRFISSILTSEGYKTGLYLSPHLLDFRERFQVNNNYISKQLLVEIVKRIQPVVKRFSKEDIQLTYFEVCTVIMFVLFAKKQVDYAIIEVGLGGRFDATNVITPIVSVITTISLDHQKYLGDKIKDIAVEKAGIIKAKVPVVTGSKNSALSVIQNTCEKQETELTIVTNDSFLVQESSMYNQTILVHGRFDDYLVLTYQIGIYQAMNIAISIAVIETMQQQGIFVTKNSILKGIKEMNHPGRMQVLKENPVVIADGAHNPDAIKQVVKSIKKLFTFDRLILIFGVMKDKAIHKMLKNILPITDITIVTEPKQKRSATSKDIAQLIFEIDESKQIIQTNSVEKAYYKALEIAQKSDLIVCTGSLFTVGELIRIYDER